MSIIASPDSLQAAAIHLAGNDPIMANLVTQFGIAKIKPSTDYYQELVDSIISQQLSVHAARSIEQRFREYYGGKLPGSNEILSTDLEALRSLGLSYAKGRYLIDLAQHIYDGKISFETLTELSNEEIITELTQVKGIGEWTAHMFLMFCMGRLDVLPIGDLGIRNGIRKLYDFTDAPTPAQVRQVADSNSWHPYESVASWYTWQSLDNAPAL